MIPYPLRKAPIGYILFTMIDDMSIWMVLIEWLMNDFDYISLG